MNIQILKSWGAGALALVFLNLTAAANAAETAAAPKTRVLVITGGHDFEAPQFFKLFADNPQITFQAVTQPKAQEFFAPEAAKAYDVIVLYDLWPTISDAAKSNLVALLQQGKGLVALHHCLASYPDWAEYAKIIGGKYYLKKTLVNGVEKPGSTYKGVNP